MVCWSKLDWEQKLYGNTVWCFSTAAQLWTDLSRPWHTPGPFFCQGRQAGLSLRKKLAISSASTGEFSRQRSSAARRRAWWQGWGTWGRPPRSVPGGGRQPCRRERGCRRPPPPHSSQHTSKGGAASHRKEIIMVSALWILVYWIYCGIKNMSLLGTENIRGVQIVERRDILLLETALRSDNTED